MKFPALWQRLKAAVAPMSVANSPGLVGVSNYGYGYGGGFVGVIREAFAGAWQANLVLDGPRDVLSFSPVFSSVTGIASDVAKLCIALKELTADGIGQLVVTTSPYWRVLRKPNHFQTRIQFVEQWILSKLIHGNTYVLKHRDGRGMVVALYILDAQRVVPMVAPNGDVYYNLRLDYLSGLGENVTVPASEVIHDRWNCLWHPLIGISPLFAAALSATHGNRIQHNSARFFSNSSRPSGILTAPGNIPPDEAKEMKARWEENYGGSNAGRTAVLGNGLKYEAIAVPAQLSQLIEQLRWTKEDCASPFHYPLFKLGGAIPVGSTVEALNQMYYADCLQTLIESLEACLDDGLGLAESSPPYYTEMDTENLLRMDSVAKSTALANLTGAGIMAPNEARRKVDLPPVKGGDSPYLQMQNYSLSALSKRDALRDPFANGSEPKPAPASGDDPKIGDDAANEKTVTVVTDDLDDELLHAWASAELRKLLSASTPSEATAEVK